MLIQHFFAIVCLLAVATASQLPEIEPHGLAAFTKAHDEVVLAVYATWCPISVSFMTEFPQFVSAFPHVTFAKLNGGQHRTLAMDLVDDGFPGLALYRNGKYRGFMQGVKTNRTVRQWILQNTGPAVRLVASLQEAKENDFDITFVGMFNSFQTAEAQRFIALAEEHRTWGVFFVILVAPGSTDAAKHNTIVALHRGEAPEEVHNPSQLEPWVAAHRFPLFGEMHGGNQQEYYAQGKDPIIFFGTPQDVEKYARTFRTIARKFNTTHSVVWMDSTRREHERVPANFGIQRLPACVVFRGTGNRRDHQRFIFASQRETFETADPLNSVEELSKFVRDVVNGNVRPKVRSQEGVTREARKRPFIHVVTGNNFEIKVLQAKHDVLLLLTAPKGTPLTEGCNRCDPLLNALNGVVPKLKSFLNETPDIGEFLVVENEFPVSGWGGTWTLNDLPVLYMVKKGATTPLELHNVQDPVDVLAFWESNTDQLNDQQRQKLGHFLSTSTTTTPDATTTKDEL